MQTETRMKMIFPLRCEAMSRVLNELLLNVPLYPNGPVITNMTSEEEILSNAMDACEGYKRLMITGDEVILFKKVDECRWHAGVCVVNPWSELKYGYKYEDLLLIDCSVDIGFERKNSAYWRGMLKWKPARDEYVF